MRWDLIFSPLSHTGMYSAAKKLFGFAEKDGRDEGRLGSTYQEKRPWVSLRIN